MGHGAEGVGYEAEGLWPVSCQLSVVSRGFAGFQRLERVPQRGTIEQFERLERVLRKRNDRTFTLIPDPRPLTPAAFMPPPGHPLDG